MDTEVLVVGAGPTGLTLADELRVAGVSAVLVDKLPRRSALSKAGGVQSRTQEALDQRGLLEPLLATGNYPAGTAHFAGITLPLTRDRHRHGWRDHEVTGVTQDEDGVTATFASGGVIRSRYLVAADGGHSTVRSLLGPSSPAGRAA